MDEPSKMTSPMAAPPRDQVESALADVIKESLTARQSTRIPGLGTFDVRHRSSARVQDGGELKFMPPRDEIVFSPEQ